MRVAASIILLLLLCGLFSLTAASAKKTPPADPVMELIQVFGCKGCHKIYKRGGSIATNLTKVGNRLTAAQIEVILATDPEPGTKNFMPDYSSLTKEDRQLISEYLYNLP